MLTAVVLAVGLQAPLRAPLLRPLRPVPPQHVATPLHPRAKGSLLPPLRTTRNFVVRRPKPSMSLAAAAFDLTRTRVRLESYGSSAVVAALLMNAALRLYSSTDIDGGQTDDLPEWARHLIKSLFTVAVSVSVLGGTYATVVNCLCGVYAKTALGLGLNEQCLEYLAMTRCFRATSFQCFVASLVSFTISFPLSLFYKTKGSARWLILGAGALITIMMVKDWITILGLANAIVYKARASLGT